MRLSRALSVFGKDLKLGPRSPIFLYALVFPVVATVLIQLVFGSLFEADPRLGIVDEGASEITRAAEDLPDVTVRFLDSPEALREDVENNDLDAGLVLPRRFDEALLAGERPSLEFYVSGESLAKNRTILGVLTTGLLRDVVGAPGGVTVEAKALGEGESLPLSDRLVPLLVMFAMLIAGLFVPAASLVEEKEKGTLTALLVTPAEVDEVLLAKGAMGLTLALAAGLITLALNQAFGASPIALVLILAIAALMALEIGLIVGSAARDTNTLFTVIKTGNVFLLAPVIFFIWPDLPTWIARIFPTYYFLNPLYEVAVKGTPPAEVWGELAVAAAICVLLVPVVLWSGRRMAARLATT